jgi:RNA polymerase sigma-70 factor (ECF subfamily)
MEAGENGNGGGSGRGRSFVEFVRRHEGELRGWIERHVSCKDRTQEILQKSFCRAWSSRTFDPEHQDARAWIFKTAKNLIVDFQQSSESASISLDDLSERAGIAGSRVSPAAALVDRKHRDPMARMIEQEKSQTLNVALGVLAHQYRDVLERYYLRQEGNQYQIAQALGLTIAAFNSRLNRARKELKRILLSMRRHDEWVPSGHDS